MTAPLGLALDATLNTFGEPALVRLIGLEPVAVTAVFDAAFQLVELQGGVEIASTAPTALVRNADLPREPRAGDEIDIAGGSYRVRFVERRQADGGARLVLAEKGVA